ncbi:DEAD/DEAH box helicase [Pseudomonas sp.]|uniref:DEAD/DEAH box helicase n=1 Tax=Pseudomonas sp. TaxID=306 RepID=UPI002585B444|nr:DEAD/DEAH box helicase [Pseudomonas sp.]
MKLRYYQQEAIQSIYDWFAKGKHAPLIVTPTGSGKSVILAEFVRRACTESPGTHILVVTHVKELVDQDAKAIARVWPHASVGVYSAGLGKRQLKPITVAGIQSIYNKPAFYGRFDIIIVDEAHLLPHKRTGMYRQLLEESARENPHVKLIGLTATPYRTDSGLLHKGEDALFDGISYEANVGRLIDEGFLCPLTARHGDDVDLSGVRKVAGDFNIAQLGERMGALKLVDHHCNVIIERCADRNAWLLFCVTVEHASQVSASLNQKGITATYITGDTPTAERDAKIAAFKRGQYRALVNCSVLTTGFDHPAIDAVIMLRPTMSPGLYVQMVGRGLRLHDSKTNCLVLDFGGNVKRHGFIDAVQAPVKGAKREGEFEPPTKECEKCGTYVAIAAAVCPECGFEFPAREREAEKHAHVGALMTKEVKPIVRDVKQVYYSKHMGKSGVPTLRVDYSFGLARVSEYVCFEHVGFARDRAELWWRERSDRPIPNTIDEALLDANGLRQPSHLLVSYASKYPEILNYAFNE